MENYFKEQIAEALKPSTIPNGRVRDIKELKEKNKLSEIKSIVFVNRRPSLVSARLSIELKNLGWKCILIQMLPPRELIKNYILESYDDVLEIPNDMNYLVNVLKLLNCRLVCVSCWMLDYVVGAIIIKSGIKSKIICEFNDVTSLYASEEKLKTVWPKEQVELDLLSEGIICREADVVITRFDEKAWLRLEAIHGSLTKFYQFFPYPRKKYCVSKSIDVILNEPIKLVFAGGVSQINKQLKINSYPGGLYSALDELANQNLEIQVYHDPNRPIEKDKAMQDYLPLSEKYENIYFKNGFSPEEIVGEISDYNFGIILYKYNIEEMMMRPELLKFGYGTKLFSYFEAGLPVIVNAEYEAMASYLEKHSLGISVYSNDICKLESIIQKIDYKKLKKGVEMYCENYSMEKKIHDLVSLFDQLKD